MTSAFQQASTNDDPRTQRCATLIIPSFLLFVILPL